MFKGSLTKIPTAVVFAVGLLFLLTIPAAAAVPQVVVVTAEGLTINDISEASMPFVFRLASKGAVGLMNPKTASGYDRDDAFITLGAGRPAAAGRDTGEALAAGGELGGIQVADIYRIRNGKTAPDGGIVMLNIPGTLESNRRYKTAAVPGLLGETLKHQGIVAAVIGNGDIPGQLHREAVGMVMDRWGRVAQGNVSRDILKKGKTLLWYTDFDKLYHEVLASDNAGLLVVETGDMTRLEMIREDTLPTVWQRARQQALTRIDDFVKRLAQAPSFQDAVFVFVSPNPSRLAQSDKNFFTPLVVRGAGLKGQLTSGTTRRPGIVTNTDLTASIYRWLEVSAPTGITGRSLSAVPKADPVATLTAVNRRSVFTYRTRPPLIKGYILTQIIVIALALAGLFLRRPQVRHLKPILVALTAIPLSLLLVVPLNTLNFTAYLLMILAIAALLVAGAMALAKDKLLDPFIFISLVTTAAIVIDLLNNAPLMKHSTLGYDAMAGARYYGIGNEYMGVLIGASVIGSAAVYQRLLGRLASRQTGATLFPSASKKNLAQGERPINRTPIRTPVRTSIMVVPVAVLLVFLITIVGAPQIGANFGGTLASLSAFIFLIIGLWERRLNYQTILVAALLVLAAVAAFTFYDFQRPAEVQSHLGRMAHTILSGGPSVLWQLIYRKVSMNIKLIRWTIWSRVFLVLLSALAVLSFRPVGIFRYISRQYPYFHRGLLAVIAGSGAALVFNDSGIVAAATMMIFAVAPLVFIAVSTAQFPNKS